MSKLKRKDLILEHYAKAIEVECVVAGGEKVTVRVWKPEMWTAPLPAFQMLTFIRRTADDLYMYPDPKSVSGPKDSGTVWIARNPDYGIWDAKTVIRMAFRRRCADIYICDLLVRPFSREAGVHFEERFGVDIYDRLLLMRDYRQFDAKHGYETVFGVDFNEEGWDDYADFYRVVDEKNDIADGTFSVTV